MHKLFQALFQAGKILKIRGWRGCAECGISDIQRGDPPGVVASVNPDCGRVASDLKERVARNVRQPAWAERVKARFAIAG